MKVSRLVTRVASRPTEHLGASCRCLETMFQLADEFCYTAGQVSGLAWSSDSELLAVHLSAETGQAVQLWRRSNWHWYLKQELRFTDSCGLQMQWSDEGPNTLTICTAEGILRKVNPQLSWGPCTLLCIQLRGLQPCRVAWAWPTHYMQTKCNTQFDLQAGRSGDLLTGSTIMQVQLGTGLAVSALGTAAVIDGCEVLLTPLRRCVVPPPLCAVTVRFQAPVQLLAWLDAIPSEVKSIWNFQPMIMIEHVLMRISYLQDGCVQGSAGISAADFEIWSQVVAAALADGSLAVLQSCEADMWEETLDAATAAGERAHKANGLAHQDAEALMATTVRFADSDTLPAGQHIRCAAGLVSQSIYRNVADIALGGYQAVWETGRAPRCIAADRYSPYFSVACSLFHVRPRHC